MDPKETDLEAPLHYADCSNQGGELPCDECDTMTDEIRADFALTRNGVVRLY